MRGLVALTRLSGITAPVALASPNRQGVIWLTPSQRSSAARRVSAPAPMTFSAS